MKMDAMKPCPFCGCYMSIEIGRYPNGDVKIVPHGLHDRYCILKAVTFNTYPEDGWTAEKITVLWNRRAL